MGLVYRASGGITDALNIKPHTALVAVVIAAIDLAAVLKSNQKEETTKINDYQARSNLNRSIRESIHGQPQMMMGAGHYSNPNYDY